MTLTTIRPWDNWEDYAAGLYQHRLIPGRVQESVRLLSDPARFEEAGWEMICAWPNAAEHNLYLRSSRRSWIGQATCCYHHGATMEETCAAWGQLANETQNRANRIADAIADEYLRGGRAGAETLFDS